MVRLKVKGQNTNSRQHLPSRIWSKTIQTTHDCPVPTTSMSRSYQCQGHISAWVITDIKFRVSIHNDLASCAKETTFPKAFIHSVYCKVKVILMSMSANDMKWFTKWRLRTRKCPKCKLLKVLGTTCNFLVQTCIFPTLIQHIGNAEGQG